MRQDKLTTLLFMSMFIGCLFTLNSCNEINALIAKAKQLIPEAGPQFNAEEERLASAGKSDVIRPYAPKGVSTPKMALKGGFYACAWSSTKNASHYCLNWSLHKNGSKIAEGTSDWIDELEYSWTVPNETGTMYVNVYARNSGGQSLDPLTFTATVKEGQKGQLVFLTHGLNSDVSCFGETVKSLRSNSDYFDLGYVTMRKSGNYLNTNNGLKQKQAVDEQILQGINVLVRTEFSAGNLSFDQQLKEMEQMAAKFDGHNADVVFIGHSMGGLASINYGIDYAKRNTNKKVKIITVSTPYQPNNYARTVWGGKDEIPGIISNFSAWLSGQQRGLAHRDLGGFETALSGLRKKWHNCSSDNITLYAISVSMYSKLEMRREAIGDGIVDIPAQKGEFLEDFQNLLNVGKWEKINIQETFYGTGISTIGIDMSAAVLSGKYFLLLFSDLGGLNDTNNSHYHTETPKLDDVIALIGTIVDY